MFEKIKRRIRRVQIGKELVSIAKAYDHVYHGDFGKYSKAELEECIKFGERQFNLDCELRDIMILDGDEVAASHISNSIKLDLACLAILKRDLEQGNYV